MSEIAARVARQVGKVADEMRDYITSTVLPTHIVLDIWERKLRRAIDDITAQAQAALAAKDAEIAD